LQLRTREHSRRLRQHDAPFSERFSAPVFFNSARQKILAMRRLRFDAVKNISDARILIQRTEKY